MTAWTNPICHAKMMPAKRKCSNSSMRRMIWLDIFMEAKLETTKLTKLLMYIKPCAPALMLNEKAMPRLWKRARGANQVTKL